jgi:hypothetical protein
MSVYRRACVIQYRKCARSPVIDSLDIGVQRPNVVAIPDVDLFRDFLASLDDLEELHKTPSLIVRQGERMSIRYPAMNSSSTRVDPEEMLEAERFCDTFHSAWTFLGELDSLSLLGTHLASSGPTP